MLKFWTVSLRRKVTCIVWITRPLWEVEKRSVRSLTFGRLPPISVGLSGPKKITVGCVIFTVPRRNSVSQAFSADTPRARPEIAIVIGSTKSFGDLAPTVASAADRYVQYYAHLAHPPVATAGDAPTADPSQKLENTTPSQPRPTQRSHSSSPESWFGTRRSELRILSPRPFLFRPPLVQTTPVIP